MSAESVIEQEHKPVASGMMKNNALTPNRSWSQNNVEMLICLAPVTEADQANSAKTTKDATMKANKEYCALLRLIFNLVTNAPKETDKVPVEFIERLRETEMKVNKFHRTFNPQAAHFDDSIILAHIYLKLSEIYNSVDAKAMVTGIFNDKLYIAKEHLTQCVKLLEGKELDRKSILIAVTAFYKLACISMQLEDIKELKQYLNKVMELYDTYTENKDDYPSPVCVLAGIESKDYISEMDALYAQTLHRLLLYYRHHDEYTSTDEPNAMIKSMHKILNKILKRRPSHLKYNDWVTFSSYIALDFLNCKRFNEARHHLAAASFVTKRYYEEEYMKIDENEVPLKKAVTYNEYVSTTVSLAVKWAQYGNTLLRLSSERFLYENRDESEAAQPSELLFADLESQLQEFTTLIKATYITDYKDAKAVFRRVLKWLEEARVSAIEGKVTDYYAIISQTIFQAYKYFAYYEREKNDKIKLYRQRMDVLYDISKSLYTDNIIIRKCIWLQLVLASYSLLDIKIEHLVPHEKINAELSAEIDKLVKQNVHISELYLYTKITS